MKKQDIKYLIEQKMRRLESLRNKNFFTITVGDKREERELEKEIKILENKFIQQQER